MIDQETLNLFDELYFATYQDVLRYVVINCVNIDDVKDIVQNIYLDVLKLLNKNKATLNKGYIIGIAKHKVKDYYRFNYKNKILSLFSNIKDEDDINLIDTISSDIDVEKDLLNKENLDYIWQYLKKQRVVISKIFYLYYYENYSIKDISKTLNISESNVKNYLYRTLDKLNSLMKDGGDLDDEESTN